MGKAKSTGTAVAKAPTLTCEFCGTDLVGNQRRWCSSKHARYGRLLPEMTALFDLLDGDANGFTVEGIREALWDQKLNGQYAEFAISALREWLPSNVVIREHGYIRFARDYDDGKRALFRRMASVMHMSDNLVRDMGHLVAAFPNDASLSAHLDIALDAAKVASKSMHHALRLPV